MTAELNTAQRSAALDAATSEPADILVIGGGVTGAGIALDAASRGLRVTLIEKHDWAAGTSSRSSKLIHGGLRYLEQRELHLVTEALAERGLLARLAPHLVSDIPFAYLLTKGLWERPYAGLGLTLYDTLGRIKRPGGNLATHSHLTRSRLTALAPSLKDDLHHGGLLYHDGSVDDARLVIALVRTAVAHGCHALTGMTATGLTYDPDGHVTGVNASDDTGTHHLAARHVIIAAGPDTGAVTRLTGAPTSLNVTASKGVHILVDKDKIDSQTGLIVKTDTSVLLVIPWNDHWLIGTTDTPCSDQSGTSVTATQDDITYLLDQVNTLLATPLTVADIVGVQAGLRPLVSVTPSSDTSKTSAISREHAIETTSSGITVIAGGKYTTYRVMAKDAVDAALGNQAKQRPSSTETITLVGGHNHQQTLQAAGELADRYTLTLETITRLTSRYGDQTDAVLALTNSDHSLLTVLPGSHGHLRCEVAYAVSAEGARTLEDVLARRLRISLTGPDHGLLAAGPAARVMARQLGWSPEHEQAEIDAYTRYAHQQAHALRQLTGGADNLLGRPADEKDDVDL